MKLGDRIRGWDDWVEDESSDQMHDARKPFDGGIMLAAATLLDAWEEDEGAQKNSRDALRDAVKELRETAEAVVEGFPYDDE